MPLLLNAQNPGRRKATGVLKQIQKEIRLTGVKFHDELRVDDGSNLFLGRHAGNLARELVTVAFQPVRNHSSLSQVKETGNQLLCQQFVMAVADPYPQVTARRVSYSPTLS